MKDLKLIYILKVGRNTKGNGLYEFIFAKDPINIDVEGWNWDKSPACDYAMPPTDDYIDAVYSLKTNSFYLYCLHEEVDRPYLHGYHTIHALAYEIYDDNDLDMNGYDDYDNLLGDNNDNIDELPLLVFHYGMSLQQIRDLFEERKVILRGNEFIEVSAVEIK